MASILLRSSVPTLVRKRRDHAYMSLIVPWSLRGFVPGGYKGQQKGQQSSQQWDKALRLFSQLGSDAHDIHTRRHLFRKVQKGYDEQATRLAVLEQQAQALRAQIDDKHSCHYNTAFSLTRVIGYAGSICINLNFTSLNLGLPYVADSGELGIRVNFDSLVLPFRTVVNLGLEELDFVLGSS
ncbi:hypothetical protein CI238_13109 [Colletotrichum incanum]|uniref:Uncharacterized protein n=1 Tax=Colletotrichum incanum TaxID=1573173 RepID=A0A162P5X2_COLIC|nr:hypothetical protein CI238_13109 [Colletotrichum incanum]